MQNTVGSRNLSFKVYALMMSLSCLMGTACARNPHRMESLNQKIESMEQLPAFLALPTDSTQFKAWNAVLDRVLEKPSPEERELDMYWRAFLDGEEVPTWFALIPLAVSGADSRFADDCTAGLWGMTEMVALRYGLFIADNYDERRDPVKATAAACAYWKHLRRRYDSDASALVAFVNTPLLYNNLKRSHDFRGENPLWEGYGLQEWLRPDFPVRMLRAAYWHSESLKPLDSQRLSSSEEGRESICGGESCTLRLEEDVPVDSVCRILSLSKERFLTLNPAVGPGNMLPSGAELRGVEPAQQDSIALEVHRSARRWKATVTAALEKARKQTAAPRIYTIRPGDSLGLIARRFKVSVGDLKRWNHLKSDRILAGKTLKIYTK